MVTGVQTCALPISGMLAEVLLLLLRLRVLDFHQLEMSALQRRNVEPTEGPRACAS